MALPASDTFLQSTGSPQTLTAYSGNYSIVQGGFNVLSGAGYANGTGSSVVNLARWNADTFSSEQYAQVVFSTGNISNGIYIGPACRLQSGAATGYHFDSNGSSNFLVRTVAGSDTTLSTPSATFADGDVCRMKVEGVGATVTITIEKALAASPTSFSNVTTYNDTSGSRITTAGYGGFFMYSDSASGGVVAWEAGDLGGATAVSSRSKKPGMHPGTVPGRFGRNVRTRRDDTTRIAATSGVSATGAVGTLAPSVEVALTGVSATGSVGTVVASSGSSVELTGVSATGSVGTLGPVVSPALTGVEAAGDVGTLTSSSAVLQVGSRVRSGALNPGDKLFKLGRFARPRRNTATTPTITQSITGVAATGAVGDVGAVRATTLSGVEGVGVIGVLSASTRLPEGSRRRNRGFPVGKGPYDFGRFVTPRRNVNPAQTAVQSLTGVSSTASVGTVVPTRTVALTGVAATGQVGSVSASQAGVVSLTGVGGTASVGSVSVSIEIALTGVQATGQVGTASAVSGTVIELTGVQATGEVGDFAVHVARRLTGVSAVGSAGTMIGTTPGTWVPVNTEASAEGWTPIAPD